VSLLRGQAGDFGSRLSHEVRTDYERRDRRLQRERRELGPTAPGSFVDRAVKRITYTWQAPQAA